MRAPEFWQHGGPAVALLAPLEPITAAFTARRAARPGWTAPIPVICCGNASTGGAGKTPVALDILRRLRARGIDAHALTRGHGGNAQGCLAVDPGGQDATLTGDEALLLAAVAPTWAGADRAATARAAIAAGAEALVLDDGLQNPSLAKTASLLVIDGGAGFGNGHLLPAGPLRESVARAAARCRAAVIIGADATGAGAQLPPAMPILRARMAAGPAMSALAGHPALAFAGIGRPEKFFATLEDAGLILAGRAAFPDHHRYTARDLALLRRRAAAAQAVLVTTTKDFVRLAARDRPGIVPLAAAIVWDDEPAFEALLKEWVP